MRQSLYIFLLLNIYMLTCAQNPRLVYIKDTIDFGSTKHIYCLGVCQTDSIIYAKTEQDYLLVKTLLIAHCNYDPKNLKSILKYISKFKNLNELVLALDPDAPLYGRQVPKNVWKYFLTNNKIKTIYIKEPMYFTEFITYCKIYRPEISIVDLGVRSD